MVVPSVGTVMGAVPTGRMPRGADHAQGIPNVVDAAGVDGAVQEEAGAAGQQRGIALVTLEVERQVQGSGLGAAREGSCGAQHRGVVTPAALIARVTRKQPIPGVSEGIALRNVPAVASVVVEGGASSSGALVGIRHRPPRKVARGHSQRLIEEGLSEEILPRPAGGCLHDVTTYYEDPVRVRVLPAWQDSTANTIQEH